MIDKNETDMKMNMVELLNQTITDYLDLSVDLSDKKGANSSALFVFTEILERFNLTITFTGADRAYCIKNDQSEPPTTFVYDEAFNKLVDDVPAFQKKFITLAFTKELPQASRAFNAIVTKDYNKFLTLCTGEEGAYLFNYIKTKGDSILNNYSMTDYISLDYLEYLLHFVGDVYEGSLENGTITTLSYDDLQKDLLKDAKNKQYMISKLYTALTSLFSDLIEHLDKEKYRGNNENMIPTMLNGIKEQYLNLKNPFVPQLKDIMNDEVYLYLWDPNHQAQLFKDLQTIKCNTIVRDIKIQWSDYTKLYDFFEENERETLEAIYNNHKATISYFFNEVGIEVFDMFSLESLKDIRTEIIEANLPDEIKGLGFEKTEKIKEIIETSFDTGFFGDKDKDHDINSQKKLLYEIFTTKDQVKYTLTHKFVCNFDLASLNSYLAKLFATLNVEKRRKDDVYSLFITTFKVYKREKLEDVGNYLENARYVSKNIHGTTSSRPIIKKIFKVKD